MLLKNGKVHLFSEISCQIKVSVFIFNGSSPSENSYRLLRILIIFAILGGIFGRVTNLIYTTIGIDTERYGWLGMVGVFNFAGDTLGKVEKTCQKLCFNRYW